VVVGIVACVFAIVFMVDRGGGTIFTLIISMFLAVAMEPAVRLLTRWMKRPLATAVVMLGVLLAFAGFIAAFGGLLVGEIQNLVRSAPGAIEAAVAWANTTFGTDYSTTNLLDQLDLTPERIAGYATQFSGGVFAVIGTIFGGVFNAFAVLLFTSYISGAMPALRNWVAGLFTPGRQSVVLTVWEVFVTKVGGYVTARIILAVCSATAHTIFMVIIDMPYWLALGLWIGVISQFVPTIGTYIAVVLPVAVGLTSEQPLDGVLILAFAIGYQQVENLLLDPRVSSRAVNVHPGVSFASVLLGAQLFGVAGGLLAVPVAATLSTVFELYKRRYEISPDAEESARAATVKNEDDDEDDEHEPDPDPEDARTGSAAG
jgi:predicted PurR-regulated permease PerM